MAQFIEVPGLGQVEFPDGMSDDQIVDAIKANSQAPGGARPEPAPQPEVPGVGQTMLIGAGRGVDQLVKGVQQLYYKAAGDKDAEQQLAQQVTGEDAIYDRLKQARPAATAAGEILPNIALAVGSGGTALPAAMARGAAMTALPEALRYGSAKDRTARAAVGGAGGALGAGVGWGIGRLLQPAGKALTAGVSDEALDAASRIGYKPTPGQLTNSPSLLSLENNWLRKTGSGPVMERLGSEQQAALNRAAARAMGETADDLGPPVLARAQDRIGSEFKRLQGITRPSLGGEFVDTLAKIDAANASKVSFSSKKVDSLVNKGLDLAEKGKLDGKAYKEIHTELTNQANKAFKAGDATLGQSFKSVRESLDEAAERSLGGSDLQAWDKARKQWAAFKTLTKGNVAEGGNVSAPRVAAQLRLNGTGFRTGRTSGDLADIGRIGEGFKSLPNPTSGQLATGGLLDFVSGAGRNVAARAYVSPAGQRYVTKGLLDLGPTGHVALGRAGGLLAAPYGQSLLGVQ